MKKISKIKDKQASALTQYCLEAHYVDELLESLSDKITIKSIAFEVGGMNKNSREKIPLDLAERGVNIIRQLHANQHVGGLLTGTREQMLEDLNYICKTFGHNIHRVRIKTAVLSHKNVTAYFKRIQKEMAPKNDLREKVKVLGLTSSDGNTAELLAAASAKRYACQIDYVNVRTVVCSKV